VTQGGILFPIIFNIFASDQPAFGNNLVADYVDNNKVIIAIHNSPVIVLVNLQCHLNLMVDWFNEWEVKINNSTSVHNTFTLRQKHYPNAFINNIVNLLPNRLNI